jgi:NitT/TauT family transport system permease protein
LSSSLFAIRGRLPAGLRPVLALVAWLVVIAAWIAVTESKLLPVMALPKPSGVLQALGRLWTDYDLLGNVAQSWWRIAQAFFWSAVVAIPLGLAMASFGWFYQLVNPIAAPMRAMPITAFLPAFMGLFGMGEEMKIGFLIFGMFFYLLAVVVEEVNRVDDSLLETAYTLGARKLDALWLLFRAAFPGIFSSFRILYDIGWTYVILAETVNARKGVGYMVTAAYKVLDFDRVYAGIIAIGVAAFLFRWLLTLSERRLFPWRRPPGVLESAPAAVARPRGKAPAHG